MQTLPTLSIKCRKSEEPLTLEYDRDSIVLYDRSTKKTTPLTPVEEVLLCLILERREQADAVVEVDYEGGPPLFGYARKPASFSPVMDTNPTLETLATEIVHCVVGGCAGRGWWDHMHPDGQSHILAGIVAVLKKATTTP